MDKEEAEKQITDIFYKALTSDMTEKAMTNKIFGVLKQIDNTPVD